MSNLRSYYLNNSFVVMNNGDDEDINDWYDCDGYGSY